MTGPLPDGPTEFPDSPPGLQIPAPLQACIGRHRAHITQRAATLRTSGMSGLQIEATVITLPEVHALKFTP